MAKVAAYYSVKPNDPKVHHDHDDCSEGNNIDPGNKRSGTGGHPKCKHCERKG